MDSSNISKFCARAKKSCMWEHFDQIDNTQAKCFICKCLVSYKSSTSNLRKHMNRKHPTVRIRPSTQSEGVRSRVRDEESSDDPPIPRDSSRSPIRREPSPTPSPISHPRESFPASASASSSKVALSVTQSKIDDFATKKLTTATKKNIDGALLQLFTRDYQPFSVVEDEGFQKFVQALNPAYTLPSRKKISSTSIPSKYEEIKLKLKNMLSHVSKLCITTDCWTSRNNDSYIAVTAHFVLEGKFINALLDCKCIKDDHTSQNLATTISNITDEWGVSSKVLFAVSDNAANITGALKMAKMKYMGCAAHKINLIVEKGLDPVEDVLTKIKRIVNHFKSSTKSWNKLTECQSREGISPPKKLINSMPTRWNSAYYMVRRFVELETPIKMAIALITSDLPVLSSIEWTVCRSLCVVLKPIEEMIQMLSKQKYPPASSVIIMINGLMELLLELRKRPDLSSVVSVIDVLLEEIKKEERFGHIESSGTLSTCTFLDPRYKLDGFTDPKAAAKAQATVKALIMEKMVSTQPEHDDFKTPIENEKPNTDKISVFAAFMKRKSEKSGLIKSE